MLFRVFLLLTLSLSVVSCSWWGGEIDENEVIKIDEAEVLGNSSSCIEELSSFFSNYFVGTTSDADIRRNFSCVQNTVDVIFDNSKEKSIEKGFSREEFFKILTAVFPNKDEDFLNDNIEILFLVKRAFAGGLLDGFSRKDQERLQISLPKVEQEFLKSKKAIAHLFYGEGADFDDRNEGFVVLNKSFRGLDTIKNEFNGELTAGEGVKLVEQIFKKESLKRFKNLAFTAKSLIYNDEDENFLIAQRDFFERLIRVFEFQARLRSVNFLEGFLFGKAYYDLKYALLLASESLQAWSSADSNWYIDVSIIGRLLSAGHAANFWQEKFSDASLVSSSIEKMMVRILGKEKLGHESMKKLAGIFEGWVSRQERIISKYNFSWVLDEDEAPLDSESQWVLGELAGFVFPQFASENNSPIVIKREAKSLVPAELYFDQSLKHILMTAAHEVFKAYDPTSATSNVVSGKEVNLDVESLSRIFQDIRPLGLEFGFNDPHSCGSEDRVLIEADSLTLSGNGDSKVSIKESVEWLATMISVASASNQIFKRVEQLCALPGMQVLGSQFLDRDCALEQLINNDAILKDHFQGTFHYVDLLKSENRRLEFQKKLGGIIDSFSDVEYEDTDHIGFQTNMYGSLNSCSEHEDFPFSKSEFNTSFAVNVYVENFFHQFDVSGVSVSGDENEKSKDPSGSDFIIDGGELSQFLKQKAGGLLDQLVPIYKKAHWSSKFLPDSIVKTTLRNLPEGITYSDRSRVFQLLKMFLRMNDAESKHPFAVRFCEDVSSTQSSVIKYRTEDRLMCLPEEN